MRDEKNVWAMIAWPIAGLIVIIVAWNVFGVPMVKKLIADEARVTNEQLELLNKPDNESKHRHLKVSEMEKDNVVLRDADEPRLLEAGVQARKRWKEFAQAFDKKDGEQFAVKLLWDDGKHKEHMWIWVNNINGTNMTGTLANDPSDVEGFTFGQTRTATLSEVEDWMYYKGEKRMGGFTFPAIEEQTKVY